MNIFFFLLMLSVFNNFIKVKLTESTYCSDWPPHLIHPDSHSRRHTARSRADRCQSYTESHCHIVLHKTKKADSFITGNEEWKRAPFNDTWCIWNFTINTVDLILSSWAIYFSITAPRLLYTQIVTGELGHIIAVVGCKQRQS